MTRASTGLVAALLGAAACVHDVSTRPSPVGPAELGLSLALSATPDVVPLDGRSWSAISLDARDPRGAPVPALDLRVEVQDDAPETSRGRLSAREVRTDRTGRARVVYFVPSMGLDPAGAVDEERIVTILATPVAASYGEPPRSVRVRLVPPGRTIPPFDVVPSFRVDPATPAAQAPVLLDATCGADTTTACVLDPQGLVTRWTWDLGDGTLRSGATVVHHYAHAGVFPVTLTVWDAEGRHRSTVQLVTVRPPGAPGAGAS